MLYQKLYAYLVGQMDEALTLLEAGEAEKAGGPKKQKGKKSIKS